MHHYTIALSIYSETSFRFYEVTRLSVKAPSRTDAWRVATDALGCGGLKNASMHVVETSEVATAKPGIPYSKDVWVTYYRNAIREHIANIRWRKQERMPFDKRLVDLRFCLAQYRTAKRSS